MAVKIIDQYLVLQTISFNSTYTCLLELAQKKKRWKSSRLEKVIKEGQNLPMHRRSMATEVL